MPLRLLQQGIHRLQIRLAQGPCRRLQAQARQDGVVARPGHVFPLRANPAGVLGRKGHTEGSVDLSILAGLQPSAVLCELMNEDGTMMRGAAIETFARARGYPILTIAELIEWRQRQEKLAA